MSQVAVFIDFENLAIGAEETLPGHTNPVPYSALELCCRDFGNAAVRRAYADWSKGQFGKYQEDLALNGVDLIQVKRFGVQQKNAADIRMAVDAMETVIVHPEVDVFVLVAGDGDYSPLVQKLREFGKTVVGVGTEASASRRLVAVCTEYKYWGTLVASVDPRARPAVAAEFDINEARPLLVTALNESSSIPVLGAWLKKKMRTLDPSFDERNYGCGSFGAFLAEMSGTVSVTKGQQDLLVELRNASAVQEATRSSIAVTQNAELNGPQASNGLLALLHQRKMDIPPLPETRDALLVSVHEAWSSGAIKVVRDVGDVLLDEETGFVPNARTRNPLRSALVLADAHCLPLAEQPDDQRRLLECRIAPWDGGATDVWVAQAHKAWLAYAAWRGRDYPDLAAAMISALFPGAEDYGKELVLPALELARSRLRTPELPSP